ncbi:hypothetical protein LCM20_17990 [Halobacillus litoralis]|uniref:hypothetical protein n=1 Tax=Halobacillus litoralis TaxID=45668 RepID=UPI001CD2D701|nr:hypothetical protein [Halobacillus litoralis]MCA0972491.1 hypothetical protein [Halobacillus litoralis]
MANIKFHNITVDQITNASGIYSGQNVPLRYKSESRKFEGLGRVVGDRNDIHHNRHLIIKKPDDQGV